MAYSKHCLNDKRTYHLNFWIEFLPEPNNIFFGTLKYCLSSSSCSNWSYHLFYFSGISLIAFREFYYYRWWVSLLEIPPLFLFFFFFHPRYWLHMGSVPSSWSSSEYDSSALSQGSSLDNIFITCKMSKDSSLWM